MSDVLVLCYHAVSETWPSELAVTPRQLHRQLEGLLARGYRGATFTAAVTLPAASRTVAVTFDDSYRSVIALAAPVLATLGLPGTVFVPTAYLGSERPMRWAGIEQWHGTAWERELVPMSSAELGELRAAGWEIGSHTHTHPRLTELETPAVAEELARSKRVLEEITGVACTSLAYPYGAFDARSVQATSAAGYAAAGTLPARFHAAQPLAWPRVYVAREDGRRRFALKVSPTIRRLRATPAWGAAAAARAAVAR